MKIGDQIIPLLDIAYPANLEKLFNSLEDPSEDHLAKHRNMLRIAKVLNLKLEVDFIEHILDLVEKFPGLIEDRTLPATMQPTYRKIISELKENVSPRLYLYFSAFNIGG